LTSSPKTRVLSRASGQCHARASGRVASGLTVHESGKIGVGDEIAELSAHLEAASFRLLTLIREFDARGGWGNGFLSRAHWLSWRIGLDLGAAREKVRVARALGTLPQLSDALARAKCRTPRCPR
jgi:hypothetical protein